jgi:hypothetical protein
MGPRPKPLPCKFPGCDFDAAKEQEYRERIRFYREQAIELSSTNFKLTMLYSDLADQLEQHLQYETGPVNGGTE